jgi:Cellulase (glycosyl hydrolase family 5)/Glycoside hydrolase family 5 C-terminal domain
LDTIQHDCKLLPTLKARVVSKLLHNLIFISFTLLMQLTPLHTRGACFIDADGRQIILRGLNLGGDSKVPWPTGGTQHPDDFSGHRDVSFVGRPFFIGDAQEHFSRIKGWGFNCLRLLTTWEAVEHSGPGQYDTAYLDHLQEICRIAGDYGLYVFIDFHQDAWSRMSGGDGAPGWTFEAVGLDFTRFDETDAAHVMQHRFDYSQSNDSQPAYPSMSWTRNYRMPANAIMWTLFWGSKHITPDFLIDGIPASDYLQMHLVGAMTEVAKRVSDMAHVIGFGSMNEPGLGWLGQPLSPVVVNGKRQASGPPMPGMFWSALDALAVASGITIDLPVRGNSFDPRSDMTSQTVNSQGIRIWRDGVACPFEQAGIYAIEASSKGVVATALKEDAFRHYQGRTLQIAEDIFAPFYHRVASALRAVGPHWLLMAEMDPLGAMLGRTFPADMPAQSVNATHWYDVTLLVKKQFDPSLSVDLLTGEHSSGEIEIGARYQRQLAAVKALGEPVPWGLPTLIGEFGIPYDLDDRAAYAAWASGNQDGSIWKTQTQVLSLMYDALDALHLSSTQWNYTAGNQNHARIGDQWNQEDLSVYSLDQPAGRAVHGFCRPYAQALQGSLRRVFFDRFTGVFELAYEANPLISLPTQIYLPSLQYAFGLDIALAGPVLRHKHLADSDTLLVWAASPGTISVSCTRRSSAA